MTTDGTLSRSQSFDNADAAAKHVLGKTAPLTKKYGLEVSGNIFQGKDGSYHYTLPQIGGATSAGADPRWMGYHTHPSGQLRFSNLTYRANAHAIDTVWVNSNNQSLYLGVQYSNGGVGVAVCEPGSCSNVGYGGTRGRVVQ